MRKLTLALTLLMLSGVSPANADSRTDDLSAWLRPRPNIELYENRTEFVADILLWRKERDDIAARAARGELPPLADEQTAAHDPDDWHVIKGPEDLDTALQNAAGYEQPIYPEPRRFNRTTHVSFPLPELPLENLEQSLVEAALITTTLEADRDMVKMGVPEHILQDVDANIRNRGPAIRVQESFTPQPPAETLGAMLKDMVQHYSSSH